MLLRAAVTGFLLSATSCHAAVQSRTRSSTSSCNNYPALCDRAYDKVAYLGAHDSPFIKDDSTDFTASGNQFYNSTVQLSAGVRLLTAQIQLDGTELNVCHTDCDLLNAGPLSSWLTEVREWMDSNPDNVVTLLLVNGASASASALASEYAAAGISDSLAYAPSGADAASQDWPTLGSMIDSGKRLVSFVAPITVDSSIPYLLNQYDYIFQNNYDVTSLDGFSCDATSVSGTPQDTGSLLDAGNMPLMNHFLYQNDGFGIQQPDESNITVTNSPGSQTGSLGSSASLCKQSWGRIPSFVVVDFFNVGPAIATVDRLNGVSGPVGRTFVSRNVLTASSSGANAIAPTRWFLGFSLFSLVLALCNA